jgi:hypothetical protein
VSLLLLFQKHRQLKQIDCEREIGRGHDEKREWSWAVVADCLPVEASLNA